MIKKKNILFLFVISSMRLLAQNWSVFNPSYRYNYSLENEGYTTAVVFADSTLTSGSDQVFSLNRIVLKCDMQNPFMQAEGCTDTSYWLANQPQFLQRRIVYSGQDYRLSDTGNYRIKHLEPVGIPWVFNATYSITAQVQSKIQKNIFGTMDSVKIILLSTADTILLSKQFGIIKYPAQYGLNKYFKLRGIENKASYDLNALYGEKVPNYYDFFKLKVGAKLYYSTQESNYGSMSTCDAAKYGIRTVLSSAVSGTVVTNTLREQQIGCPTPNYSVCPREGGGCNPIIFYNTLRYPYSNISALQTSTVQNTGPITTINSMLNTIAIYNKGYNNQLFEFNSNTFKIVKFGLTDNSHFFKTSGKSCFSNHIQSNPIESNVFQTITLVPVNTNTNVLVSSSLDNWSGITYIEGYGQVNSYEIIFETYNAYCTSLIIDGNDSLGRTDALTMSLNEAASKDNINRVYPNPAKHNLTVLVPYEAQTHGCLLLTDAMGNGLKTIKTNGEETLQLNMEPYAIGIYFLKIESPKYSRTFKVIRD